MPATVRNLAPYEQWRTSYLSDGRGVGRLLAAYQRVRVHFRRLYSTVDSDGLLPMSMPGVQALQSMGYAVFLPIRRGHNDQPGTFWLDRVTATWGGPEMGDQLVSALRAELRDVMAGVNWVAEHPDVDIRRVVDARLVVRRRAHRAGPRRKHRVAGGRQLRWSVDDLARRPGAAASHAGCDRRRAGTVVSRSGVQRQQPRPDLCHGRRAGPAWAALTKLVSTRRSGKVRVAGTECSERV